MKIRICSTKLLLLLYFLTYVSWKRSYVILLDYVSSRALLYREGPPVRGLDTPEHVPGVLIEGDHGLVPGLVLVHKAVRLDVIGECEADPVNGDVVQALQQQGGVDIDPLTSEKVVFIAASLRLKVLLDRNPGN